ncbi:MAG: hypothetical protein JWM86_236 [Thermoleophilia bacterium]|nr:hypothetical protein [Thermoleophilia bacterium]
MPQGLGDRQVVLVCIALTVLLRIPFLTTPLGIDEGGYAYVAANWGIGDGGLYGAQWVDRPPLLIALYAVAIAIAGDVGVRLLGSVAAVLLVAASMGVARQLAGSDAMRWTGIATVTLTSSTLLQAYTVNAELPAAALVAASVWLTLRAMLATGRGSAWAWSTGAGAVAASAVLVKQSFVDGFVFAVATLLAAIVLGRRDAWRVLAGGLVGAGFIGAIVAAWAQLVGPGIGPLLDALYGFRLDARATIAAAASAAPRERAWMLAALAILSGMLALFGYAWVGVARIASGRQRVRSVLDPVVVRACAVGLCAMGVWGVFAIGQGGNWWRHYLIQLVPMLAVSIGLIVGGVRSRGASRVARGSVRSAQLVAAVTFAAWLSTALFASTVGLSREPATAGDWLRAASSPGDTAFVAWGHPNVLRRSGMTSPYSLSWSLPIRVRDPQLDELRRIVRGPEAPTWIVEWRSFDGWQLDTDERFRNLVRMRYERVSSVCGRPVYRLRSAPASTRSIPPRPSAAACGSNATLERFNLPTW